MPKYPDIAVQLTDVDGNVFSIIGAVSKALKRAHVDMEVVAEFRKEAMSGDYDHAIQTCMAWVEVS